MSLRIRLTLIIVLGDKDTLIIVLGDKDTLIMLINPMHPNSPCESIKYRIWSFSEFSNLGKIIFSRSGVLLEPQVQMVQVLPNSDLR